MNLKDYIRSIPDYPKKGILFRDITTLIKDADAFEECINQIIERSKDYKIDKIAAIESRGYKWIVIYSRRFKEKKEAMSFEYRLKKNRIKRASILKDYLDDQRN